MQYANDFKESRYLNLLKQKGTHVILYPSLNTSFLFGLTMKETKYKKKTPKIERLNASSLERCRHSDSALHEEAW